MKCTPACSSGEGSVMPMWERHLTQVVLNNDKSFNYSDHQLDISVFKFWTVGGIFLYMFSDALLFDMMLNTAYEDGINTIQDLIDTISNTRNNKKMFILFILYLLHFRFISFLGWNRQDYPGQSTQYASTVDDINYWYLDCKECNWYKSKQSILSEARLTI